VVILIVDHDFFVFSLQLKILMMRATHFRAPCGVRVAGIFNSICLACPGKTSYLRVIFPDLRVYDICNFFSHISATKMMFWTLARVCFRAAKIVSCNNKKKFHGLRSKLPQLFYFSSGLRGHRKTYLTIIESADHALFKMLWYVLLRPLRPGLYVIQNIC
jgi:hypothetical protein